MVGKRIPECIQMQNGEDIMTCTLIHGDCIKEMQKLIEKEVKVDMVLTDPPYGSTDCKWDSIIPFEDMWGCINNLTYDKTPVILFSSQPFTSRLVSSNYKQFKHEWIYQKRRGGNFATFKFAPAKVHENILVFCKKSPNYYPIKEKKAESTLNRQKYDSRPSSKEIEINGLKKPLQKAGSHSEYRYPISVRQINNLKPKDRGLHPTQKPVELLEYLIKTYTNEGDLVLDFTMGSGSTGVACLQNNRNFIGIEIDEKYYNIAKQRCSEYQSKLI